MKRFGFNYTMVVLALSFFVGRMAVASGGGFVKTQREDFSAMIAEGVESEKQLRKELREQVGLKDWHEEKPAKTRKAILLKGPAEQIAVPSAGGKITTVKKVKLPTYTDLTQDRVSQEIESIEH